MFCIETSCHLFSNQLREGENCVAIAADTRLGRQQLTISTRFQKIFRIHDKLYIALGGLAVTFFLLFCFFTFLNCWSFFFLLLRQIFRQFQQSYSLCIKCTFWKKGEKCPPECLPMLFQIYFIPTGKFLFLFFAAFSSYKSATVLLRV